jgi:transcriptional regulator GlxA family with amidase domain
MATGSSRSEIERRAEQLRAERREIGERNAANIRAIVALLDEAKDSGVALDDLAELVDVSSRSLRRWEEAAALQRIREAEVKGHG